MIATAEFLLAAKWVGIATLAFAALAVFGFIFKWGIRFRLVGITGFMGVLTGGLFALGLVPFIHTEIPGAVHFSLIYDNGATQAAIALPPDITESQLDATLRQAAGNLFSNGRLGNASDKLTIRARTIIHPEPGVSQPLYLGQVTRSLSNRDEELNIEIYRQNLAQKS
ncbi:Ycf51 family protein [Argonema antarcticum]|uniref:Ycf51 family protein n=1 Tax=Argonema antarcticum TaxID=2942763 RepID=UPI002012DE6C|nr:Ycf51 family protein [Argonema antarcticum]MCL1473609.1 Ycf51 family protein [Argonema antarcticum A004/B2]